MSRRGGGFGLVILVVVFAVVLLLAVRAWRSMATEATGIVAPVLDEEPAESGAAASSDLPRLQEMREETAAHADRVREALEQSN